MFQMSFLYNFTLATAKVVDRHKAVDQGSEMVEKSAPKNCRFVIRGVAEALSVSYGPRWHILVAVLDLKRVSASLVPKKEKK